MAKEYIEDGESLSYYVNTTKLQFNVPNIYLNFQVRKIVYKYDSVVEETLYDNLRTTVYFNEIESNFIETDNQTLDYISVANCNLEFVNNSQILNFVIKDYDGAWVLYKVLIDFIENYTVGDVFLTSALIDTFVDM